MSSIFSFILIFFLLCLSQHGCKARYNRFSQKTPLFEEDSVKQQMGLMTTQEARIAGATISISTHEDYEKNYNRRLSSDSGLFFMKLAHDDVSVSNWRVPHKIKPDKTIPGFYSDYSRPRTRPPSHN